MSAKINFANNKMGNSLFLKTNRSVKSVRILNNWKNGKDIPHMSEGIPYIWRTSKLTSNNNYLHKFIKNDYLPKTQNYSAFREKIKQSRAKYVTSFLNLSGDTILVVPIPQIRRNFATMYHFQKNSTDNHKYHFWKKVAYVAENVMHNCGHVYISVHGFGVPYFHIRVSDKPKYY